MNNTFYPLIEETIKIKDDDSISKLSLKLNMDVTQTKLFLKYFQKFDILSSFLDSEYVNYFNRICLTDLKENDELTDENFAKAISIFIKEKPQNKNKKLYYVSLFSENDIKINVLILSQLDYKSFKYEVSYDNIDFKKNLDIFKYISTYGSYDFENLTKEIINNQIDAPSLNCVNLNNISIDKVLNYSKKYPNRIKRIDFYDFNEYEKLKELIELNKDSLTNYPISNPQFLVPLENAHIISISELIKDMNNINYDLTKITCVNGIWIDYEEDKEDILINLLNKCPNLEELAFSQVCSDSFFKVLENIKCPKVKVIYAICEDLNRDYDWSKVFENLPLLEKLSIEEHQTMCWSYEISPIFLAENKRLSLPLLEQLIRNYLNGSQERDITLQFDDEFDEFWDYFKDKKDIISRISKLYGTAVNFDLDTYFKLNITEYEMQEEFKDAKYYFCFVQVPFNEKIMDIIKKNKIEYLFILNGGDVNLEELKKCDDLKFIFDKETKEFLFRNEETKILNKY